MKEMELDFTISRLGECRIPSPMRCPLFVSEDERVLFHTSPKTVQAFLESGLTPPSFEKGGPREKSISTRPSSNAAS